jgi:hypothetical protein
MELRRARCCAPPIWRLTEQQWPLLSAAALGSELVPLRSHAEGLRAYLACLQEQHTRMCRRYRQASVRHGVALLLGVARRARSRRVVGAWGRWRAACEAHGRRQAAARRLHRVLHRARDRAQRWAWSRWVGHARGARRLLAMGSRGRGRRDRERLGRAWRRLGRWANGRGRLRRLLERRAALTLRTAFRMIKVRAPLDNMSGQIMHTRPVDPAKLDTRMSVGDLDHPPNVLRRRRRCCSAVESCCC